MMEALFERQEAMFRATSMDIIRSFMGQVNWNAPMLCIRGSRGVGKSTILRQYIRQHFDVGSEEVLYCSLDWGYFTQHTILEVAEQFYKRGGKLLVFDEVHKYDHWSREVKEIAMQRIEEAARTMRDFEQVIALWDDRDKNAARTRRNREVSCGDMPLELKIQDRGDVDLIFPEWMNDPTFRQIMRGNYLDYLYDCPYEMHDLTGQEYLRRPVMRLKEEHKEIIYFLYLRLYEPKDLAAVRGQTSRNIRKVRDVAQRKVRRQVYASLQERKAAGCSLTKDERDFLAECKPNGIKPPLKKHKKESA